MRQFIARAQEAGVRLIEADGARLAKLAGSLGHQGVAARVQAIEMARSLDDLLDAVQGPPLILVLDGVTDPHNLGACLRVADGAGAHAVIAPKDHAVGINATVAKVASGAAETVPYFMVTNLARTLGELKERTRFTTGKQEAEDLRLDFEKARDEMVKVTVDAVLKLDPSISKDSLVLTLNAVEEATKKRGQEAMQKAREKEAAEAKARQKDAPEAKPETPAAKAEPAKPLTPAQLLADVEGVSPEDMKKFRAAALVAQKDPAVKEAKA